MLRLTTTRRAGLSVVVTILVAAAFTVAQEPDEPTVPAPGASAADARQAIAREARDAERQIRRALQTEVTLEFKDEPLQEALRELTREAGVPLWIDETALTEEGISIDEPVSADLEAMSVETALERIHSPLGLRWHIEDEVLKVTTESECCERLSTEVYDVGELLRLAEEAEQELSGGDLGAEQLTIPVQFGGGEAFGGVPVTRSPDRERTGWLLDLLIALTSGAWEDVDGVGGTARILNGALVVRQTQRVHGEIVDLLDLLTRAAKGELAHSSAMVHPPGAAAEKIQRINDALARKGVAEFRDATLRSALDSLGSRFDVPLIINEVALTQEGISLDEPVTLNVHEVTLHSILKLLLEPLGLTTIVRFGVLEVTSETEAAEIFVTMVYDIRDLAGRRLDPQGLLASIQEAASGEWEQVDGVGGVAMVPFAGVLAVRQTQKVHGEIALLLTDLRRTLGVGGQGGAAQAGKPRDLDEVTTQLYRVDLQAPVEQVSDAINMFVAGELEEDSHALTIMPVGSALMIRATNRAHAEVRKCLQLLRQVEADADSAGSGGVYGPDDFEGRRGSASGGGFFSARP